MSAISLKSITGITSITTPAGVDDQLTLHTNDTTQRVKVTQSGIDERGGGTGCLVLHCTNNFTVKGNASNKNRIIAKEGGAVELYHNNTKTFSTN